jgi:hypothetical protein
MSLAVSFFCSWEKTRSNKIRFVLTEAVDTPVGNGVASVLEIADTLKSAGKDPSRDECGEEMYHPSCTAVVIR